MQPIGRASWPPVQYPHSITPTPYWHRQRFLPCYEHHLTFSLFPKLVFDLSSLAFLREYPVHLPTQWIIFLLSFTPFCGRPPYVSLYSPSSVFYLYSLRSDSDTPCNQVPEGKPFTPNHTSPRYLPCRPFSSLYHFPFSVFNNAWPVNIFKRNSPLFFQLSLLSISSPWSWTLVSKSFSYFLLECFALSVSESTLDLSSLHVFSIWLIVLA